MADEQGVHSPYSTVFCRSPEEAEIFISHHPELTGAFIEGNNVIIPMLDERGEPMVRPL